MLRPAVSHGYSAGSWNISPAPLPFRSTVPLLAGSSPATMFSSVDLPQDAPSSDTNSPSCVERDAIQDRCARVTEGLAHPVQPDGRTG